MKANKSTESSDKRITKIDKEGIKRIDKNITNINVSLQYTGEVSLVVMLQDLFNLYS